MLALEFVPTTVTTFLSLSCGFPNFSKRQIQLDGWKRKWQSRIENEIRPHQTMSQTNPIFIPRNHLVEEALRYATKMNDLNNLDLSSDK